jgi:hypothetical protein
MADADRGSRIRDKDGVLSEPLVQRLNRRLGHLKKDRSVWEPHWRELADHFKPRSGNWNNQTPETRGGKNSKQQVIINNTGLRAGRTLAAGMMAGLTSPARPWFRLTTPDPSLSEFGPVKNWLWIVEQRLRAVLAKSNVYRVLPNIYAELGVFGTSACVGLEDEDDIIRLQPWEIGSFWAANDARLRVDSGYRETSMTVRQMVQEFGLESCSVRVQNMFKMQQWEQWIDVYQAVEPNDERLAGRMGPSGMSVRSCYWEKGGDPDKLLDKRGFHESPLLIPRWIAEGDNAYGDAPAMDALGDAKALQFEERRKAQALDKLVDPPMTAPTSLRNQRVSLLPGDVTYVDVNQTQNGFRPVYEVRPDMQWQTQSIKDIEERINSAMYVDLFLMLANSDRRQITAREIDERHEEKMLQLGPVLERMNDELLDPLIDRVFAIMVRRSMPMWSGMVDGTPLLPPPPEELAGMDLKVEYISILAQAQKMVGIQAADRLIAFTGQMAAAKADPTVWDKIDTDQMVDEYNEMLGGSPLSVRSDDDVEAMRTARAQQAQMQQMAAMAQPMQQASQAMKNLGETQVGGDQSALEAMINQAAGGQMAGMSMGQ